MIDHVDLSRVVSHALRHEPEKYGLKLDDAGWVPIASLLVALGRLPQWQGIGRADLVEMIRQSKKVRHEIDDSRIRALYGHSTPEKLGKMAIEPPDILFHGTDEAAARTILREGLIPMARHHVHLSADRETAEAVGLRKTREPVILLVAARQAWRSGVKFYVGNESVWLADSVPSEFISEASC